MHGCVTGVFRVGARRWGSRQPRSYGEHARQADAEVLARVGPRPSSPRLVRCLAVAAALLLSLLLPGTASASLSWSGPVFDSFRDNSAIACPSVGQCTVVNGSGVWTFDPASPESVSHTEFVVDGHAVACPALNQCTALDLGTFDPAMPSTVTGFEEGALVPLQALACPSVSQCTATDVIGGESTFDPQAPPEELTRTEIDGVEDLLAVACPSESQCTAIDLAGRELTFNPQSPSVPKPVPLGVLEDSFSLSGGGLACPSVEQCTAVTDTGEEVTFDPTSPGTPKPVTLNPDKELFPPSLSAVACASVSSCTAVGSYCNVSECSGVSVTFDPSSPGSATTSRASTEERLGGLIAVACPAAALCAAAGGEGSVFVGRSTGPPENTAPPTISGIAEQGQTLKEEHGSWTNNPTSFIYQWEDCNGSGGECGPIEGATSQSYLLAPQDVGHTIRVQETASNEAGSGGPATSEATAVVQPASSEGGPQPDEQGGAPNESEMPTTCSCGQPVNTATGVLWHTFTDAQVPGLGIPLDFTRTYMSSDATVAGPLGYGWTNSYEMHLSFDAKGNASIVQEDAAVVSFLAKTGGYQAAPGVLATLVKNGDGTYTFKRNSTNGQFVFNSAGKLVSEIDRHGYKTQLTYGGSGELTKVTDQAGRSLTLAYAGGHLASVKDPLGHTTSFEYDLAGDLVETTDPLGRTWRFSYDAKHLLLTMTDPNGGVTTSTYDGSGRVINQIDPAGRVQTFNYSGDNKTVAGGTTTVTDPRGLQTQYRYKSEELTSVTAAAGTAEAATTSYQYDPATFGQTSITDADGNTTTNTYDARGDLLSTTDPLGKTTKATYDSEGDRLTTTDALGVTTTKTYGSSGNLLSSSTPLSGGGTAKWAYTYGTGVEAGDRLSSTDPDGNTTNYTYDTAGDRTSITDPLSNKTTMTYDGDGRLLTRTSPNGGTTTNVYDADGELTSTTDPLGHSTTYAFDANGNRTFSTDANGHTTTYVYDADNELTQTTQPDGSTSETGYDGDGNVISQTDGNGHTTGYSFDALNQIASSTDPDGRTTKYTYDGVGNLLTSVNPAGQIATYSYDADQRTTAIAYSDGATPAVHESYDADGRRVSLTDGTGTSTFVYDSLGRLTSETNGAGATSSYAYDPAGNVTQITYPNGKTVSRAYDADNRLKEITDWLDNTTTFSYDGDGNLTAVHLPGSVTDQSVYNAADQLTAITDANAGGNLAAFTYTRDPVGQVTSSAATGAITSTDNYSYDSQNRLTADNATGYAYDAGNNATTFSGQPQRFDAADQLLATGSSVKGGGEEPGGGGSSTTTQVVEHGGVEPVHGVEPFHENSPPPVTIAATAKTHKTSKGGKLTAGPLTTISPNQLLLAFVATQGPKHGQHARAINGGGLRWSLVTEASSPDGTSSIWKALAARPLSHTTFTASLARSGYSGMMDVVAFAPGASVGPVAKRSGARSAASLSLNASATATIFAVAHDAGSSHARKALGDNHISDQALGGKHGGASWTLSAPGGTPAIGLGGGKSASWSLAAVAVLPAATAARVTTARAAPVTWTSPTSSPVPLGSATPLSTSPATVVSSAPASPGETTYTYNAQGDRTAVITPAGSTSLSYDQANRLTAVGENISYSYDGDGLRMSKTVAGETTAFAWDESYELPLLLQGGDTSYIYGPSGQPIEQITGTTSTYLLGDQQGSTRLLTDSSGAVVGTYTYDAWGNATSHTGEASSSLQYDGQYTDAETGYQYLRARYYDPGTGSLLTRDPLVAQTRDPYTYVQANPLNVGDPAGMCSWEEFTNKVQALGAALENSLSNGRNDLTTWFTANKQLIEDYGGTAINAVEGYLAGSYGAYVTDLSQKKPLSAPLEFLPGPVKTATLAALDYFFSISDASVNTFFTEPRTSTPLRFIGKYDTLTPSNISQSGQ
jgi:RHS repeat-associated protein